MSSRHGSRSVQDRLQDILDAVAEIRSYIAPLTFDEFVADRKTVRAVELNFIIIGESCNAIPDEVQEHSPEVPWHLMRGMRNRIVHAYFAVDEALLWHTCIEDLPQVEAQVRQLLEE